MMTSRNRLTGVSLIEVLVALMVLSFSVLGAAAMNVHGLAELRAARSYNRAAVLAVDLANRYRIYASELAPNAFADCGSDTALSCVPERMPASEFSEWQAQVAAQLPDGDATVDGSLEEGIARYRIALSWSDGTERRANHALSVSIGAAVR